MRSYLTLAIISAIAASMVFSSNSAIALTNDDKNIIPAQHGCSDGKQGGHYYLSGKRGGAYHTAIFMQGYNDGYSACSPSPSSPAPSLTSSNQDFSNICQKIVSYLVYGCGEYVNPNGALTTEGQRAHDCILGGGLLSGAGLLYALPPLAIIAALEPLSNLPFYECGGIVQWDTLRNDVRAATFFLGILGL